MLKLLTVWITKKLWKILKETGVPDHLTCLLRNLYVGQEATLRTRHGIMDWFKIGKGVHQDCIVVVVQSLSYVWLFATPWTAAHQSSLSFTTSWSVLKLRSIESVMPSNHLILCCPFLLLPSIQKYSLGTHCFCPGLSTGGARSPTTWLCSHTWAEGSACLDEDGSLEKDAERTGRGLLLCSENAVDLLSHAPVTCSIRWWWRGPLWWSSS